MIKIWVDDIREMPEDYDMWVTSVYDAISRITRCYKLDIPVEISLDHDAGEYVNDGGDYIRILEHLEEKSYNLVYWKDYIKNKIIFNLHTANPVGRENMRRIIQRNGWREV